MHVCRDGRDWDEMLGDRGPEKHHGFSGYFKRIRYSRLKKGGFFLQSRKNQRILLHLGLRQSGNLTPAYKMSDESL